MIDEIERISVAGVSAPAGHYSHATAWNGLVFASGQLGGRGDGAHIADQPQVRQALGNVLTVLAEAGCGPERVLRVTADIVGVENWLAFNRVYARLSEAIEALWTEIDFSAAEWRIPAERMKGRRPHTVPLSPQAIELLNDDFIRARGPLHTRQIVVARISLDIEPARRSAACADGGKGLVGRQGIPPPPHVVFARARE